MESLKIVHLTVPEAVQLTLCWELKTRVCPFRLTPFFHSHLLYRDASVEGCCTLRSPVGNPAREGREGRKGVHILSSHFMQSADGGYVRAGWRSVFLTWSFPCYWVFAVSDDSSSLHSLRSCCESRVREMAVDLFIPIWTCNFINFPRSPSVWLQYLLLAPTLKDAVSKHGTQHQIWHTSLKRVEHQGNTNKSYLALLGRKC